MSLKIVVDDLKRSFNYFSTENVAFRLLSRSDTFPLYQAALNPKFNEKLAWGPPSLVGEASVQIDLLLREMMANKSLVISMVEKNSGAWMGIAKLSIYLDSLIQSLWFHPDFWAKPSIIYGSSAVVDVFFKETELKKIYAKHAVGHITTEKLLRRNGFVYKYNEPVFHENGNLIDCKTYELNVENWKGKTNIIQY